MKMEQTECSEISAYKIQTLRNYPEEIIQRLCCCLLTTLTVDQILLRLNEWVGVDNELERTWKEAVVAYVQTLCWNLSAVTEMNDEKLRIVGVSTEIWTLRYRLSQLVRCPCFWLFSSGTFAQFPSPHSWIRGKHLFVT